MRRLRVVLLALLLCCGAVPAWSQLLQLGQMADFHLVERSGRAVSRHDLLGRVWVVDFIYTMCPGPCPLLSEHMAGLQKALPSDGRLGFLSISVDPQTDTPAVLTRYAANYHADPQRWWFLTGSTDEVETLLRSSFHVAVDSTSKSIIHSQYFALVDDRGAIRGYYDVLDPMAEQKLRQDVVLALPMVRPAPPWAWVPAIDAGLCAAASVLVLVGWYAIKRRHVAVHRICMLSALGTLIVFLVSDLVYYAHVGALPFVEPATVRRTYLSIVVCHAALAVGACALVLATMTRALQGRFAEHVPLARWTVPVWLYVSCAGVVVYLMLYQLSGDGL
jgi:cytochrome oxidase Cu insertion factor (SCO1/SenC/PrrC family)